MNNTLIPLIQWSVYKCTANSVEEFRLIGWYKRSYISSALVSFDASARIFTCEGSKYFIPDESAGTNFKALFMFNCWLEQQNYDLVEETSSVFYSKDYY